MDEASNARGRRVKGGPTDQTEKPCLSYQKSSFATRGPPKCSVAEWKVRMVSGERPLGFSIEGSGVGAASSAGDGDSPNR